MSPIRPLGSLSMRRITLFVSAMLMALFTTIAINTATVQAQTTTTVDSTATWDGDNLILEGRALKRSSLPVADNGSVPDLKGTACENNDNVYYSDPRTASADAPVTIVVVCLDEEFDGSDKSKPISANLVGFQASQDYTSRDDFEAKYIDTVEVSPEGTDALTPLGLDGDDNGKSITTCDSEHTHGLGWIICPLTNLLADSMDLLYEALSSFLVVSPLSTDRDNVMYYIWDLMRNFANILFIVGFLVIIYSQITNYGLSNYGLKRLLPRLIIAAVLVNISYWISAAAIDLSNVLGVSLKEGIDAIRKSIPPEAGRDLSEWSWKGMAGFVLSGSALSLVGGTAVAGLAVSAGGSLWFLLVGLAGVILAGLVAILVLAARQALITILVIVSPLAFVAYLLPSTEKYFDKWKDLFMTLLLVYPIFSVVFGGAQLAGLAIIESADPKSANYFNVVILGMIVQVAPVVITPLLIKLSGSLLGKIAGFANNPNRGIVDQTRKFAQGRHDMTKNRQMWAKDDATGKYRNNNPLAAAGRWNALREIDKSHKLKAYESGAEAAYEQDHRSHTVHTQTAINEMLKSTGSDEGKAAVARDIANRDALRRLYTHQQVSQEDAKLATDQNKTSYEQARTNPSMANTAIRDLAERADSIYDDNKRETMRLNIITQTQEGRFHERMIEDVDGQNYAGAVEIDVHGPTRVLNISQEAESKAREARVNSAMSTLSRNEAKLHEERAVIIGNAADAGDYANLTGDIESRSGALRRYISRAPIKQVQSLLEELDITISANGDINAETLRSELVGALQKRKPFYVSQTNLNKIEEGTLGTEFRGKAGKTLMIKDTLNSKGLGTNSMVTIDRDDLQAVRDYLRENGIDSLNADAQASLRTSLDTAFRDARYSSQMDKRTIELGEIWDDLGMGQRP